MSMYEFQISVRTWILECFGSEISDHKPERNQRFLEEALELVQSCGMTQADAHTLVDYVFSRASGNVVQEVGGTMVTLAALCGAQAVSLEDAAYKELVRIENPEVMEKIRAKQATKPHNSPLPGRTPGEPDIRL